MAADSFGYAHPRVHYPRISRLQNLTKVDHRDTILHIMAEKWSKHKGNISKDELHPTSHPQRDPDGQLLPLLDPKDGLVQEKHPFHRSCMEELA